MSGRHAPRSRTGCSTCRCRKVKCDETRPSCRRCQSAQVRCEWLKVARRPRGNKVTSPKHPLDGAPPRQTRYLPLLPRGLSSPPTSLSLSDQDREYLAFFPHSSLVQWIGKPWRWASLNYLHSKIAPHSPVIMKMILAIAATELEGLRCAAHRGLQQGGQVWEVGAGHYRSALREFHSLLGRPLPYSKLQVNEILAAFLLMVVYEYYFSPNTVGLVMHLRGIYTFLRSCGVTFQQQQGPTLPELSQQLLLFVMYIHLAAIQQDQITPHLWQEAGYESHFSSVLDQIFQASRNTGLAIWQSDYPTEELVDDISVFRPLELFNECNKVKSRLLLRKQRSLTPEDAERLAQELASIGNRFQDLIAASQRSASGLRKRELQTIYFSVADYHATNLLLHQRSCVAEDLECHRKSLEAALEILRKISRDDDSKLGRLLWVMAVVADVASEADHRHWIQEALTRTHRIGFVQSIRGEDNMSVRNGRLLRIIDWLLMPLMGFSYMLQFLDKQALGQSAIMGIIQDLKLSGNQYSWAGSIFYLAYLVFSYPASMLMVRLPIGKVLAVTVFLWGGVLACHAASFNFAGIMATRFFLGATEAAVSPGFSLITGMWYTREEQPLRHGLWFAGISVAMAFGGLVSYGVVHITGSIPAWKWLFIIYGVITMLWAIVLLFFLPDSISSARFLKQEERRAAEERIQANQTGAKHNVIQWEQVWEALRDYKIWILFFFQIATNIPNGGLTMFGSLVLAGFGFSTLHTYLLQMPMGAVHALFTIGSTFFAGNFRNSRCILVAVCIMFSLIGCLIIYKSDNKGARLFGMFLFTGYAAGIPMTLSMVSSNVAGFTKKATVSAMMFIAYCIGNIVGPFLFFDDEAPSYDSGFISIIIWITSTDRLLRSAHMRNQRQARFLLWWWKI
ncbi:major facilitator superfamily domain-containing protein [Aspergillus navahoensis]